MCSSSVVEPSGFRVFGFVRCPRRFLTINETSLSGPCRDPQSVHGQLALHLEPLGAWVPVPLPPASTNKEIKLALLECWQDEVESIQSLATSDGSGHDELQPLVASSDEDDDWEEEDDEDDAWGSPPSSPRVTPAGDRP